MTPQEVTSGTKNSDGQRQARGNNPRGERPPLPEVHGNPEHAARAKTGFRPGPMAEHPGPRAEEAEEKTLELRREVPEIKATR